MAEEPVLSLSPDGKTLAAWGYVPRKNVASPIMPAFYDLTQAGLGVHNFSHDELTLFIWEVTTGALRQQSRFPVAPGSNPALPARIRPPLGSAARLWRRIRLTWQLRLPRSGEPSYLRSGGHGGFFPARSPGCSGTFQHAARPRPFGPGQPITGNSWRVGNDRLAAVEAPINRDTLLRAAQKEAFTETRPCEPAAPARAGEAHPCWRCGLPEPVPCPGLILGRVKNNRSPRWPTGASAPPSQSCHFPPSG